MRIVKCMMASRVSLLLLCVAVAAFCQTPTVQPNGVVNAAALDPAVGLAPGTITAVFGANLANGRCTAATIPVPTRLCDAQVTVRGVLAPILTASPEKLDIQIPVELPPGPAELVVERQGVRSTPVSLRLDTHAPGLPFTEPGNIGTVLRPDSTPVSAGRPAVPDEVLVVHAFGLGPTTPVVATGAAAPVPPPRTASDARVTLGGEPAEVLASVLLSGFVGQYQVNFRVPRRVSVGTLPLVVEVGGKRSNAVNVSVALVAGVPRINNVVNGATFGPDSGVAAPGSILSVFGSGLATRDNVNLFPATEFEGLSATFNGIRAPLFHVVASSGQVNLLAPSELPESGEVAVQLKTLGGISANYTLRMVSADPGIFRISSVFAAAVFANTAWLAIPSSLALELGIPRNCTASGISPASICGQPAAPGDVIQLFVAGLGKATPGGDPAGRSLPSGSVAPADGNPLYRTVVQPVVTVAGIPAQVLFSGLAPGFAGLYQVNFVVPASVPRRDRFRVEVTTPNGRSSFAVFEIQ